MTRDELLKVVRDAADTGDEDARAWLRHEGRIVITQRGANARLVRWTEQDRRTPEAEAWRVAVFQRDRYRCRRCGRRGALHAHHILSWSQYSEYRFDLVNGITLCPPCHADEHPRYKRLILKAKYHFHP